MKYFNYVLPLFVISFFSFVMFHKGSPATGFYRADNAPELVPQGMNPLAANSAIIKLVDPKTGIGMCSATVIAQNYAVTAAHCVFENESVVPLYKIFNHENKDTGITATVVGAYSRMDYALITGDFSEFSVAPINPETDEFQQFMGSPHLVCGYPLDSKQPRCSEFLPSARYYFSVKGFGTVLPGMSGGPAINMLAGTVDGVISAALEEGVVVNSLYGIFNVFNIKIKGQGE